MVTRSFYRNPHIYLPFLIAAMLFAVVFFVGYTEFADIRVKLVLHEDAEGRIDLTGARKEIFFAALIACAFFLMNSALSKAAYSRERLLSYMLSYSNVWIGVLMLVYMISVANLN